eukprot:CAMPEP_0197010560 /NCGR_PEP_ID=MMETSP1380-20130617/54868_1 /TAXON_ID=5936 /ORGANISM="Euplotes crassus, Strain CT5" /LENGTH=304 /DNA_ID=CAMNT_0042432579 /DNA_START=3 /DNA_END=917 /DNA_ORIENTATION=+
MSKFTNWGDFFRFSTDVLDEGYVYDKNYLVKLKTKAQDKSTEYAFKLDQSKPGEDGQSKNAIELKYKYSNHGLTQEGKVKSGGKLTVDTEYELGHQNDNLKGWSYHLDASLANGKTFDHNAFTSGVSFKQDNIEAKTTWDHGRSGTVQHEFAFKPQPDKDFVFGGESTLDYKKTNLTRYALGFLGRIGDNLSWGVKTEGEEGKRFGDLTLYTLQDVNADTSIATKVGYSHADKNLSATAGFSHSLGDGSSWKAKISSAGLFGVSWAHKFNNGTTLTLSSAVDLGDKAILHNNPHPLGISFEGKF